MLVDEIEKLSADICFNFHVVWGIELGDVSFDFLSFGEVVSVWSMLCKINVWIFSKPWCKVE